MNNSYPLLKCFITIFFNVNIINIRQINEFIHTGYFLKYGRIYFLSNIGQIVQNDIHPIYPLYLEIQ